MSLLSFPDIHPDKVRFECVRVFEFFCDQARFDVRCFWFYVYEAFQKLWGDKIEDWPSYRTDVFEGESVDFARIFLAQPAIQTLMREVGVLEDDWCKELSEFVVKLNLAPLLSICRNSWESLQYEEPSLIYGLYELYPETF